MKKRLLSLVLSAVMLLAASATSVMAEPTPPYFLRMSGANRYDTSLVAAKNFTRAMADWEDDKAPGLVLATGENFPDALTGTILAITFEGYNGVPLLLVDPANPKPVLDFCRDYVEAKSKIYMLGGVNALPESLFNALGSRGYDVRRITGQDRWETNLNILEEAYAEGYAKDELIVTTGTNYPDALSASGTGIAVMIVDPSGLNAAQKAFLKKHYNDYKRIILLGGQNALPLNVEQQILFGTCADRYIRVAGATRYETSYCLAETLWGEEADWDPWGMSLVTGTNFPDGLSAGPMAYWFDDPVILTNNNPEDYKWAKKWNDQPNSGNWEVLVLGGENAIPKSLIKNITGYDEDYLTSLSS
ncbi:MAG: cell wall-binding repeat-containing protein [Lachnospiraceae bacterium]|nr:cell wall-binding repeat-containing protein [Candidatus Equihabitans merdae]